MKNLFTVILISLSSCTLVIGQDQELETSEAGFIYSKETMGQLKYIVDSLNLQYYTCDLGKTYYSKMQARGHYIVLEKNNARKAFKDIEEGISFESFQQKYPKSDIKKEQLLVKFEYENYDDESVISFESINIGSGYSPKLSFVEDLNVFRRKGKGTWITSYTEKSDYSEERLKGFYLTTDFSTMDLIDKYASMVGYSECMVDTNTQVFFENAKSSGGWYGDEVKEERTIERFLTYVSNETNEPNRDDFEENDGYWEANTKWREERMGIIKNNLAETEEFKSLLNAAINSAIKNGNSNWDLEAYTSEFGTKEQLLALKRSRIVVGQCSMDNSPRLHAQEIAKLSAEVVKWEIFLRAHLDIMNDRFQRVSDGSYAYARRKTYIAELEELNINVADLILGITLRIENPSKNHYYGSISRLGRALAETRYADEIETKMLDMIMDKQLDLYNRVLVYYLFDNYNYYLTELNVERAQLNQTKIEEALLSLPKSITE